MSDEENRKLERDAALDPEAAEQHAVEQSRAAATSLHELIGRTVMLGVRDRPDRPVLLHEIENVLGVAFLRVETVSNAREPRGQPAGVVLWVSLNVVTFIADAETATSAEQADRERRRRERERRLEVERRVAEELGATVDADDHYLEYHDVW